jgi:hypothetical protein
MLRMGFFKTLKKMCFRTSLFVFFISYYVQCAPGAVPPFNEALMNIENAMHATSLLMGILDVFYDMHPDLRPDINAVHKLYAQDSDIVDALLSHSNCKPVKQLYPKLSNNCSLRTKQQEIC